MIAMTRPAHLRADPMAPEEETPPPPPHPVARCFATSRCPGGEPYEGDRVDPARAIARANEIARRLQNAAPTGVASTSDSAKPDRHPRGCSTKAATSI